MTATFRTDTATLPRSNPTQKATFPTIQSTTQAPARQTSGNEAASKSVTNPATDWFDHSKAATSGVRGAAPVVTERPVDPETIRTFPKMFFHRVEATPDRDAFMYLDKNEAWQNISWRGVAERVKNTAGGLHALGLLPGERTAILSGTRLEWILADLATLCAGAATTTLFPTNSINECNYILSDSDARVVFVENDEQLAKLEALRDKLPHVLKVINISGQGRANGWAIGLSELEDLGRSWNTSHPGQYEKAALAVEPSDLATLIYTSGTTGQPKGVELTHDCWAFEGEAAEALGLLSSADKQYLWLPLAHSFGKFLEVVVIRMGIPTAIDGRVEKLAGNLGTIKPTISAAVPRVFEKVYNKIQTGAAEGGKIKRWIFNWAVGVGKEVSQLKQHGTEPSGFLAFKHAVADHLVFSKIRHVFGGNLRFFLSGGAPLSREIAEFLHAAGIVVLEGYGLTESSGASVVNRLDHYKFGSVGQALPGVDLKLDAKNGEILMHGRGVMRGYHGMPKATADTMTDDGWLRTGDVGVLDSEGFLTITDRIKNLIKTSNGKYVAPQKLEGNVKVQSPLISQVLVHGDKRRFCSALITLDADTLKKWAHNHGLDGQSYAELVTNKDVYAEVQLAVSQANKGLEHHEVIARFAILPKDFSIETGELTPSQKVKRKVVEEANMKLLDSFYVEDGV